MLMLNLSNRMTAEEEGLDIGRGWAGLKTDMGATLLEESSKFISMHPESASFTEKEKEEGRI